MNSQQAAGDSGRGKEKEKGDNFLRRETKESESTEEKHPAIKGNGVATLSQKQKRRKRGSVKVGGGGGFENVLEQLKGTTNFQQQFAPGRFSKHSQEAR